MAPPACRHGGCTTLDIRISSVPHNHDHPSSCCGLPALATAGGGSQRPSQWRQTYDFSQARVRAAARPRARARPAGGRLRPDRRGVDHRPRHRPERRRGARRHRHGHQPGHQRRRTPPSRTTTGNYTIRRCPSAVRRQGGADRASRRRPPRPITLEAKQIARLDFKMEVGALEDTVEVTAQAPVLQTETATVGEVHLGQHRAVAAAQRPQHRPARAAAAGHDDLQPAAASPTSAPSTRTGRSSTATASRRTTSRSTAST